MVKNSHSGTFSVPEVKKSLVGNGILCRSLPAGKIAMELGAPLSTNLALLGFFAAVEGRPFSAEDLLETIERISPERFRKTNIDVFKKGARLVDRNR